MWEDCVENTISIAFNLCEFFSVGLDNALRIRDKMQVVYKKMTRDWAKSYVAKWNLIGGIQFKHVKNCPMFKQCNDWVCSDWTLNAVFMVCDEMQVVWPMHMDSEVLFFAYLTPISVKSWYHQHSKETSLNFQTQNYTHLEVLMSSVKLALTMMCCRVHKSVHVLQKHKVYNAEAIC